MSIDKSTMKIFFEGMQGNMLSGGYTSKIITTPMGPFKWNDVMELWENVNNGMVMNNMSFQDMMIIGYESESGDNGGIFIFDGGTCANSGFTTSQNVSIRYISQDNYFFSPSTLIRSTNTCNFELYVRAEDFTATTYSGFTPLSVNDFEFFYKNTLGAPGGVDDPTIRPPYIGLTLGGVGGANGTLVTISPGTTFGYNIGEAFQSKFNVAFKYKDANPSRLATGAFKLKVYNKTTGAVIHTAGVTFDNYNTIPTFTPSSFGNLQGITTAGAGQIFWASSSGPKLNKEDATDVSLNNFNPNVMRIYLESINTFQGNLDPLYYSINDDVGITYTTQINSVGITIGNGDTLKIGGRFPPQGVLSVAATSRIRISNKAVSAPGGNGLTLGGITWSFDIEASGEPELP